LPNKGKGFFQTREKTAAVKDARDWPRKLGHGSLKGPEVLTINTWRGGGTSGGGLGCKVKRSSRLKGWEKGGRKGASRPNLETKKN